MNFFIGTICDNNQCRSLAIFRRFYEAIRNDTLIPSTTSMIDLFSSPPKDNNTLPSSFIYILLVITFVSLLCFILIIFIITMLIKTHRCRLSSSSEDKVSSSSFVQSTSTAISTDYSNEIYQFQQLPILASDYPRHSENYLIGRPTIIHGIVPQANLSPRFYRQYQGFDKMQRRGPLQIKSPSLSSVNKYIDHGLLAKNKYDHIDNYTKKRNHLPRVTHLENGDVVISA